MEDNTGDRFDRIDQTLDRILGILVDHGHQLDALAAGQAEIRADIRQIRAAVDSIQEAFAEHLTWHLGRA
jgi:hypothetical protein